jgi:hypothetical protein
MSNSLGAMSGNLIGQRAMQIMMAEYPFLSQISTDCSAENVLLNQTLKISLPQVMAAADFDGDTGYVPGDVTQTQVDLTVDQFVHCTYGFTDVEVNSTATNLIERFAAGAAHGLAKKILDSIAALIVSSKFSNATTTTAADLSYDTLVGISQALSARSIPSSGRWCLLNGDAYAALAKDVVVVANAGSPTDSPRSGKLHDVAGLAVNECPWLPSNSQRLIGAAGWRESLLLVTRIPQLPKAKDVNPPGNIEVIVEPSSGLSLQARTWYDMSKGKTFRSYALCFGVAAGHGDGIQRIVSPAS